MPDDPRDPTAERPRASDPLATVLDTSATASSAVARALHESAVVASRFTLERELGRGGAAVVWLARDADEHRLVAVKLLRAEVSQTVAADRFLEEIRILTELSHPRLLPILASGEWNGVLYYVSPYVERGSLRVRLERERQLPLDEALAIVTDVAAGLEFAHGHRVIHRDVKPENILLGGEHAYVADFGIARALVRAGGERFTSTGITLGTPAYMSPEQAAGNRDLDERSDVYSLGCVLYEMLAGIAPFVGPTPESVIAQRFLHPPHPLRMYRASVPRSVESAVERAMAIAPADRFRSMREFIDALERPAAPATAAPRASPARRPWFVAVAGALLAIAATALLVYPGADRIMAWQAFIRGRAAVRRWDLENARTALQAAATTDPSHAEANLWLAQVGAWSAPTKVDDWKTPAMRAVNLAGRLTRRDSLLAAGVGHLAVGEFPRACDAYARAVALEPVDDVPWYGLGQCRAMDTVVVRDPKSPSGWAFRGSYHTAAIAYDSAIARASGAPAFAFDQLRRLLLVQSFHVRLGWAQPPDTGMFVAHPSLDHDTLAYVPFPSALVEAADPRTLSPTMRGALDRNASRLDAHFREWARRAPRSPNAHAALAFIQELRGEVEPSKSGALAALPTLRTAVGLSESATQRVQLTASLVRVLLKEERFSEARRLADSLLAATPQPSVDQADYLAGVAALVGNVGRAEALLSLVATRPGMLLDPSTPPRVAAATARLTADAALGVCGAPLAGAIEEVDQLIDRYVAPERRTAVRTDLLSRPLTLAVPCLGPAAVGRVAEARGRLVAMQHALASGRTQTVRSHLDTLSRVRRVERAGDIALDITYQEAWLLLLMRDSAAAHRHLCMPLSALPTLGTRVLRDVPQAAAVGRSLALCAQLAARRGDAAAARRWASALTELWSRADAPLQPVVATIRPLAAEAH